MNSPTRSWIALSFVFALCGCRDLFDFDGISPPVNSATLPAQMGELAPVDGTEWLDESFGVSGVAASNDFADDSPARTVVDGQSRPLTVGYNGFPFGVRVERLDVGGQLDTSFGVAGAVVLVDLDSGSPLWEAPPPGLLVDGRDRIWLAFTWTRNDTGEDVAAVVRLLEDGEVDGSFGDAGWVFVDVSAQVTGTRAVDLLDDGAGGVFLCANESLLNGPLAHVIHLNVDGELDSSYGQDGVATMHAGFPSLATAAVLDSAGRVVLSGSTLQLLSHLAVWRLDASGAPDEGFGSDGLVVPGEGNLSGAILSRGVDVVVDSLDRVLVLGDRSTDLSEIDDWPSQLVQFGEVPDPVFDVVLYRLRTDGSLDDDFASGGRRDFGFNSGPYYPVSGGSMGGDHFDAAAGLFVDPLTDAIHVAGWSDPAVWETAIGWAYFGPTRPFLAKLTSDGALDPSLAGSGHVLLGWNLAGGAGTHTLGEVSSLARDGEGRWLLSGLSSNGSQRIRRVLASATP